MNCCKWIAALVLGALLSACGGGGSGSSLSGSSSSGGSSSSSGSSSGASPGVNVATITVDAGPTVTAADGCSSAADQNIRGCTIGQVTNSINVPYVTVTICVPNTTTCQTIDHISVDTGSSGLRIISTALNSSLLGAMPATVNGAGQALTECYQFGSGYMWGSVRTADVHIPTTGSGTEEVASAANIQIVGDTSLSLAPSVCTSLPSLNDVYAAGTNGFLGIGLFVNDCTTGATCPAGQGLQIYFNCPSGGGACTEANAEANHQVANPVATLVASDGRSDNSGAIMELPNVSSATGSATSNGTLVFGIDTRTNNNLTGSQRVVVADFNGNMNGQLISPTTYGGTGSTTYSPYSFFDSGSNGIYLPGTTIPCSASIGGWFTPSSTLSMTASVQGASDANASNPPPVAISFPFVIGNASTLFNTLNAAFDDLAAPAVTCPGSPGTAAGTSGTGANSGIDFGLPAFMGLNMYVGLETNSFVVGTTTYYGPLWAF